MAVLSVLAKIEAHNQMEVDAEIPWILFKYGILYRQQFQLEELYYAITGVKKDIWLWYLKTRETEIKEE